MSKSNRTLDERIEEKRQKEQELLEKAKNYSAQIKQLEQRKRNEENKARTHRLILIGAEAESVLGRPITDEDIPLFRNFLLSQEKRGKYFSKALNADTEVKVKTASVGGESDGAEEVPGEGD